MKPSGPLNVSIVALNTLTRNHTTPHLELPEFRVSPTHLELVVGTGCASVANLYSLFSNQDALLASGWEWFVDLELAACFLNPLYGFEKWIDYFGFAFDIAFSISFWSGAVPVVFLSSFVLVVEIVKSAKYVVVFVMVLIEMYLREQFEWGGTCCW